MKISIPYPGKSRFTDIPEKNILTVVTPKEIPKVSSVKEKVLEKLRSPIGVKPFSKRLKEGMKICVLVDDVTRRTPIREVLPVVLDEIMENGIKERDIKVWVARGAHRAMTEEEVKEKVGEKVFGRFETRVHNFEDKANLMFKGHSSRGTPIWVNKAVVESDAIIGIGGVLLHWFAGYGGGAKMIVPGISGRETILYNHNILESRCCACNLEGNPLRGEMEEVARRVGLYMKIDCVMNSDNDLVDIFAGDFIAEHRQAVKKYNDIYGVTLPKKVEVVLTSTMPKYHTFTQGIFMPLCTMYDVTTDNATVIISCPAIEGYTFSTSAVENMKAKLTIEQLEQRAKEGSIFEAITYYHLARIRDRRNVIVVSENLTEEEMIQTGFKHAPTIEKALDMAFARHGQNTQMAVIPYGFSSVPMLAEKP